MTAPLSAQRINALRIIDMPPVVVRIVGETGSTNTDLLSSLDSLTSATLLVAEMQTAGRGRAGRTWHADRGRALTFSLAWKFQLPVQSLVGLSLAIGVVIAEVLTRFDVDARLKWPNDVLKEGKKLSGILIETASAANLADNEIWAVIGIGLNMTVSDQLSAHIGKAVADMHSDDLDRNVVLAALLDALVEALMCFEKRGFGAFMARWNALDAYVGQQVRIMDRGQVLYEGSTAGVDEIGRLLLDTATGRIAVMAGDVSLRTQEA